MYNNLQFIEVTMYLSFIVVGVMMLISNQIVFQTKYTLATRISSVLVPIIIILVC